MASKAVSDDGVGVNDVEAVRAAREASVHDGVRADGHHPLRQLGACSQTSTRYNYVCHCYTCVGTASSLFRVVSSILPKNFDELRKSITCHLLTIREILNGLL